jgi:hypothetical protein
VPTSTSTARFATRTVHGIDDAGSVETITLWIEWQGGQWAVGRVVNGHLRENPSHARPDDYLFTGHEMQDALTAANDALDCDLDVSRDDGRNEDVDPFREDELRTRLERWFFERQRVR